MKRQHSHLRTVSSLPNLAYVEDLTNNERSGGTARLLILGTEGVGKTSVFKQLRNYCGDHPVDELELEESRIGCIEHMLRVCKQLAQKYLELKATEYFPNFAVAPANETRLAKFSSLTFDDGTLWTEQIRMRYDSPDLYNEVQHFMSDEAIRKTYSKSQSTLMTNADYFIQQYPKFWNNNMQITFEDYVRLQSEHGIYDEKTKVADDWNLEITDVCGKRSQRTLWSSVFNNNYTAILYVASLADFDKNIKVDGKHEVNKLIESMELLKSLVSISYFKHTNFILMLNQKEIFDKKLSNHKISFVDNFPLHLCERFYYENKDIEYKDSIYDYNSQTNIKQNNLNLEFDKTQKFNTQYCTSYIKKQFTKILPPHLQKTMRIYITCAVASHTFSFVISTLSQEVILLEQLRNGRKHRLPFDKQQQQQGGIQSNQNGQYNGQYNPNDPNNDDPDVYTRNNLNRPSDDENSDDEDYKYQESSRSRNNNNNNNQYNNNNNNNRDHRDYRQQQHQQHQQYQNQGQYQQYQNQSGSRPEQQAQDGYSPAAVNKMASIKEERGRSDNESEPESDGSAGSVRYHEDDSEDSQ